MEQTLIKEVGKLDLCQSDEKWYRLPLPQSEKTFALNLVSGKRARHRQISFSRGTISRSAMYFILPVGLFCGLSHWAGQEVDGRLDQRA